MSEAARRSVGLLVQTSLEGKDPAKVSEELSELAPAGVVLFRKDIERAGSAEKSVEEVRRVLKDALASTTGPLPLISADEEGGYVRRVESDRTPSAMALGASFDYGLTRKASLIIGQKLHALGINWDFAPVADVNFEPSNPVIATRSFGDNPGRVASHVVAFIEGLRTAGVLSCAKHFPGHGRSSKDSHLELPTIDADLETVLSSDLVPFRAAIQHDVDAIMVGHLYYPRIQKLEEPCSVSREIISGLLRQTLGFDGVVATDALSMKGLGERMEVGEAAVRALKAGCDLLETTSLDMAWEARHALEESLSKGNLETGRVLESAGRVEQLMQRGMAMEKSVLGAGTPKPKLFTARDYARCVTMYNQGAAFPKRGELAVVVGGSPLSPASDKLESPLSIALKRLGYYVRSSLRLEDLPRKGERYRISFAVSPNKQCVTGVLIVLRDGHMHPQWAEQVSDIVESGLPVGIIGIGTPYESSMLPDEVRYVCTYSSLEESLCAALRSLTSPSARTKPGPVRLLAHKAKKQRNLRARTK